MKRLSWTDLKVFIDAGAKYKHVEFTNYFWVAAFDPPFEAYTEIDKNPSDPTDLNDWNNNYLVNSNSQLTQYDTSGRPQTRGAIASKGFTYQAREMVFTTSLLNSVYCKKHDLTDWGDVALKFYDSSDTELTVQTDIDANCVQTKLIWTPAYDYEVIGGWAKIAAVPTNDVRIWLKANLGTATQTMVDCVNFKTMSLNEKIVVDGRVPKFFKKDSPVPGAHALAAIIRHNAGEQHKITIVWEHYKA